MNCQSMVESKHEFASKGIAIKDYEKPLEGDLDSDFKTLPREAAKNHKKSIQAMREKLQHQTDMLDVLMRVGFADPTIRNKVQKCLMHA